MTERMPSSNRKGERTVHDEQVIAPAPDIFEDELIGGDEDAEVAILAAASCDWG
jgi:hypothetical protein